MTHRIDHTLSLPLGLFCIPTKPQDRQHKGLVGYFVIGFEVPSYPVYFSTSPHDTPTHWRQRIFFLNEPIQVQTGPLLCSSSISCFKNKDS
ncbi:PREDICTED: protein arginine N-methyltransferase 1-like [Amphimedon queenslandica]|uniref:Protein arginine N-methyltransferase domain-containing protein n=1 Tax=Amphimedon queenslandica TaxID=400682 RepID=A0AAN0JRN3_AMPQE|nr:PREDICTED: protein arginine N-methyltransferase 1-like [Amphimedon queenslandica]|eukprot:XP_019859738.1 PREDICTED: protein arginine N-methyltransferase 1-like [Amphimedon queenslandica]